MKLTGKDLFEMWKNCFVSNFAICRFHHMDEQQSIEDSKKEADTMVALILENNIEFGLKS